MATEMGTSFSGLWRRCQAVSDSRCALSSPPLPAAVHMGKNAAKTAKRLS